jgi:hypothetical protein
MSFISLLMMISPSLPPDSAGSPFELLIARGVKLVDARAGIRHARLQRSAVAPCSVIMVSGNLSHDLVLKRPGLQFANSMAPRFACLAQAVQPALTQGPLRV